MFILREKNLIKKHRRAIAYVAQESLFFPSTYLTVRDHLIFAAAMRFNSSKTTAKMREKEVDAMVESLALGKCANSPCVIVSGGERRRCAIGCELLCPQPLLLLLDEATSGLDSSAAISLIRRIHDITTTKKVPTLITIHSPSSEIFSTFNKVMFLSGGKMVYFGSPSGVMQYLVNLGYSPAPSNRFVSSAPDFMLSLLCDNGGPDANEETYLQNVTNTRLMLPHASQSDISSMAPSEVLTEAFDCKGGHLDEVIRARDFFIRARRRCQLQERHRHHIVGANASETETGLEGYNEEIKKGDPDVTASGADLPTHSTGEHPPSVVLGALHELADARRARYLSINLPNPTKEQQNDQEQCTTSSDGDSAEGEAEDAASIAEVCGLVMHTSPHSMPNSLPSSPALLNKIRMRASIGSM